MRDNMKFIAKTRKVGGTLYTIVPSEVRDILDIKRDKYYHMSIDSEAKNEPLKKANSRFTSAIGDVK